MKEKTMEFQAGEDIKKGDLVCIHKDDKKIYSLTKRMREQKLKTIRDTSDGLSGHYDELELNGTGITLRQCVLCLEHSNRYDKIKPSELQDMDSFVIIREIANRYPLLSNEMLRWIPIKEKLPPLNTEVYLLWNSKFMNNHIERGYLAERNDGTATWRYAFCGALEPTHWFRHPFEIIFPELPKISEESKLC